ncbi:MAG TPA: 30S ribosomal protein S6 [Candidatus Paceibacterota bacterium]
MSENIERDNKESETAPDRVVYEIGYHILPTVGEEHLSDEVKKIKDVLEEHGGVSISEELPTLSHLAYTIIRGIGGKREKYDTSYFGWVKFDLPMGVIVKLKEEFERNESILRFLLIRTVREDTRAPRHLALAKDDEKTSHDKQTSPQTRPTATKKDISEETVSEEDLNRTIEELVVE